MSLEENLNNRRWLLERLRAEVVGPDPFGESVVPADVTGLKKMTWNEFREPRRQVNGEEILWQDPPTKRYGAGIVYPIGMTEAKDVAQDALPVDAERQESLPVTDDRSESSLESVLSRQHSQIEDSEDYDVTLANAFKPSAIGLSFLASFDREQDGISIEVVSVGRLGSNEFCEGSSAVYRKIEVKVGDPGGKEFDRALWLRTPLLDSEGHFPKITVSRVDLLDSGLKVKKLRLKEAPGIEVVIVSRPWCENKSNSDRLLTVSLVNRREANSTNLDSSSIFQAGIRVSGLSSNDWILPYPERTQNGRNDEDFADEESMNRLLYRQYQTYGIGHGCSADWKDSPLDGAGQIWSDVLPAFETAATTADLEIVRENGERRTIKISMRKLGGLDPKDDGRQELNQLIDEYELWIRNLEANRTGMAPIPADLEHTAGELVRRCRVCLSRIRDGLKFLDESTDSARCARSAFRLANRAMLIAQLRASRDIRIPVSADGIRFQWEPPAMDPDPSAPDEKRGYWRPFQIAFLLMSLRGICDPEHKDRNVVDLIWFPTGGGKTEAYLGLTAFTIFFNRLSGRLPGGVDVLMRYTLRLLTAQQFQRAALLFCAMESLRSDEAELAGKPFRIGLWVGSATTPNTRADALGKLRNLENDSTAENPFVLLKCPWCGARFGPNDSPQRSGGRYRNRGSSEGLSVTGYYRHGQGASETVVFRCPDHACKFGKASPLGRAKSPLPVVVIDEDMVDDPPNLLIGTVDKFAMLAWKPDLRRLFGILDDGRHQGEPPSLIIQDELHLISGPLGTMVGAYETLIDRLCRENGKGPCGPKIVASTATISRSDEQVRNLYARESVMLFPPSGLDAGDSFFAREARYPDGSPRPGRLYAGIMAPGHGSLQTTQARVFASLLQSAATMSTDDGGRDPWWTLLCFFNSLRELGGAATLFVADARDYLRVIIDRAGLSYESIRSPYATELTSRIRSDEIPKELERLERCYTTPTNSRPRESSVTERPVDVCLASNIIEVGVDIDRLSLMAIVGQPKTTSQYIQVSSRVGRNADKPGLVTILYGQSKPRDRSHYERFRSYHQRLYAQVEPTSVTPFSLPAVDRALHGLVVAAVRQLGNLETDGKRPDPFPLSEGLELRSLIEQIVRNRVEFVASQEGVAVMEKLKKRLDQWRTWNPGEYGGFGNVPEDPPLMHPAGSPSPPEWNGKSWPTLSSLRDVDAGCEADITDYFNRTSEAQI